MHLNLILNPQLDSEHFLNTSGESQESGDNLQDLDKSVAVESSNEENGNVKVVKEGYKNVKTCEMEVGENGEGSEVMKETKEDEVLIIEIEDEVQEAVTFEDRTQGKVRDRMLETKRGHPEQTVAEEEPTVKEAKISEKSSGTINDFSDLINQEKSKFMLLGAKSSFSIYKKPITAYQHFTNLILARDRQSSQASQKAREDVVERVLDKWKEYKNNNNFPIQEMSKILESVTLSLPRPAKQRDLKEMFNAMKSEQNKPSKGENIVLEKIKERKSREPYEDEEQNEDHSAIKELGKILSTELLAETSKELKNDPAMKMAVTAAMVHVPKFLDFRETYKSSKSWSWKTSQFSKMVDDSKTLVTDLKTLLNTGEGIRREAKEMCKGAGLFEISEISSKASIDAKENSIKVLKKLLEVNKKLKETNSQLGKRFSMQKLRKKPEEMKIEGPNSSKTWEECLSRLEGPKCCSLVTMLPFEFFRIKELFDSLAEEGQESTSAKTVCTFLGRQQSEQKSVAKLILLHLPVLSVGMSGQEHLIDCRVFFMNPERVIDLYEASRIINKTEAEEKEKEEELMEPDPERKKGSGRKRKITAEMLESVQDFMTQLGTSAHERRRDFEDRFGGRHGGATWEGDVYKFVKRKFFQQNPEDAPSKSTVRRLGLAPRVNHSSSSHYRGLIKAKPMSTANQSALGETHRYWLLARFGYDKVGFVPKSALLRLGCH